MIAMAFFAFYFLFIGTMVLVSMGSWVVTILAVLDCARRDFPDPNTRALWCVLIVVTKWIGALVYYIVIYRTNDPLIQQTRIAPQPGQPTPRRSSMPNASGPREGCRWLIAIDKRQTSILQWR